MLVFVPVLAFVLELVFAGVLAASVLVIISVMLVLMWCSCWYKRGVYACCSISLVLLLVLVLVLLLALALVFVLVLMLSLVFGASLFLLVLTFSIIHVLSGQLYVFSDARRVSSHVG